MKLVRFVSFIGPKQTRIALDMVLLKFQHFREYEYTQQLYPDSRLNIMSISNKNK